MKYVLDRLFTAVGWNKIGNIFLYLFCVQMTETVQLIIAWTVERALKVWTLQYARVSAHLLDPVVIWVSYLFLELVLFK